MTQIFISPICKTKNSFLHFPFRKRVFSARSGLQLSLAATEEMFLVATGNYVYEKDAQRKITKSGEKINSNAKRALTKRTFPFSGKNGGACGGACACTCAGT